MVFLTAVRLFRVRRLPHPDHSWKYRWVFNITQHFFGRRRNCYTIALRAAMRALMNSTKGREVRKKEVFKLYETRINAACNEHGTDKDVMLQGLAKCNIVLNRQMLSELAIREPRTFKCLADISAAKVALNPSFDPNVKGTDPIPPGVITRGML